MAGKQGKKFSFNEQELGWVSEIVESADKNDFVDEVGLDLLIQLEGVESKLSKAKADLASSGKTKTQVYINFKEMLALDAYFVVCYRKTYEDVLGYHTYHACDDRTKFYVRLNEVFCAVRESAKEDNTTTKRQLVSKQ